MDRGSERKRARYMGRSGRKERNRKITEKADEKKGGNGTLRKVILSVRSWMIEGLIGYYRTAHCYMIVITAEYVNRRVKSEFNTIINRDVIAEMYAWFQIRFYR